MAQTWSNFVFAPNDARKSINGRYAERNNETEEMKTWVETLRNDEPSRIEKEFEVLSRNLPNHSDSLETSKSNVRLNRYNDIHCFEATRVPLTDGLKPNYIHANWLSGYKRDKAYILTQGPLLNTVVDFWRLVWQENVATVVMITRLEEKGKDKCSKYFPFTSDMDFQAGFFKIRFHKFEGRQFCVASLFTITNLLDHSVRPIVHVWYTNWPDQSAPDSTVYLRHLSNYCRLINGNLSLRYFHNEHIRGPPILYHCSAGIGRSATMIACDIIQEGCIHNYLCIPWEIVTKMRKERYHAIHTKIQLLFIYHYALDSALLNFRRVLRSH